MAQYLFTYGTLQPGHAPSAIASAAERLRPVGEGHVHGILYDFGHYPGAVLDASAQGKIFGSVYQLPDDPTVLQKLDAYEECFPDAPEISQYLRVQHPVELATGATVDCWVYIYNRDVRTARIVESGRWRG
jgi:gamma-glutamylcyclotransferase (GGCT)/AIG2-like uncharacterized protein YtfP